MARLAASPRRWRPQILTGQVALKNATGGALNYPRRLGGARLGRHLEKTTQIGNHIFYRGGARTRATVERRSAGPKRSVRRRATNLKIQSDIQIRRAVRDRA